MKTFILITILILLTPMFLLAQEGLSQENKKKEIQSLVNKYTHAREKKDRLLLESILTKDIDQLVSSGTWRRGKEESMKGMLRSSQRNPGKRTITVENIRFLTSDSGIADARYEILNADGSSRKMWSTFVVVYEDHVWKIAAIRNMLPAR